MKQKKLLKIINNQVDKKILTYLVIFIFVFLLSYGFSALIDNFSKEETICKYLDKGKICLPACDGDQKDQMCWDI